MIELLSIQFHGVVSGRTIPLRRNDVKGSQFPPPEWRKGMTDPADSPAAYLGGVDAPKIRVRLRRSDAAQEGHIEVQAKAAGAGLNLLGSIQPQPVDFSDGQLETTADLVLFGT